ncbi:MAG: phosphoglycerate dehydrogenase [Oscillospiraceae bacterium]|jgi:D-3-phosphoglycerate dehydrogenase|nr:phosphoglycerate dehydrogenase [Oscillospiraceae bacterium]
MKILITPRSFAKDDPRPLVYLEENGLCIVRNPGAGIMDEETMRAQIAGCDGVVVGVDPLSARVMEAAPGLRAVAKYGVGVDNIDLDYCAAHGIRVSRTVGANSGAVADYTFALMLALARQIIPIDRRCRRGDWSKITTADLSGRTLGLVGLGAVGRQVVRRAQGFSMDVAAFDVAWDEAYAQANGVRRLGVDELCAACDFLSLHLPLRPETKHIIDARRLGLMKPTAYLINTARGGLVDDDALLAALRDRRIAGAGLDAFRQEPPDNKEWYELENIVIGSHCAASTAGAARAMSRMAAENLLRDLTAGAAVT